MYPFMFVTAIIMVILLEGSFWVFRYRFDKENEYANDERWQAILIKVDGVCLFQFHGHPYSNWTIPPYRCYQ